MNRLDTEQQRLFGHAADGLTRTLVLGIARPADWSVLRAAWQGVQADLALPAPAIAVSGTDSYQLWFSLAQPVALDEARHFLEHLCQRYLPDIAAARVTTWPQAGTSPAASMRHAPVVPSRQDDSGHWSAFVSPDLPAVFGEDPWLDMAPGLDAQADLLSRMVSIQPDAWAHALQSSRPAEVTPDQAKPLKTPASTGGAPMDPRQFLMAVMNDGSAPLALRIEAAKVLLAHGEKPGQ